MLAEGGLAPGCKAIFPAREEAKADTFALGELAASEVEAETSAEGDLNTGGCVCFCAAVRFSICWPLGEVMAVSVLCALFSLVRGRGGLVTLEGGGKLCPLLIGLFCAVTAIASLLLTGAEALSFSGTPVDFDWTKVVGAVDSGSERLFLIPEPGLLGGALVGSNIGGGREEESSV